MTPDQIDRLIARRDRLTNRRDGRLNRPALDEIDAQLRQVPPGQDNRIDLLLGRPCAQLTARADYGLSECAAEIHECPSDWRDMRGDCDA